ncbi:hypothetical protein BJY04DRAFT_194442 [Aspergillus karnatakaensis]|uniref:uncharacterized protein n=1 Tax=Aspergillus karnatakaensis TaxID=1810916 RepID=UPI003CCC93B7
MRNVSRNNDAAAADADRPTRWRDRLYLFCPTRMRRSCTAKLFLQLQLQLQLQLVLACSGEGQEGEPKAQSQCSRSKAKQSRSRSRTKANQFLSELNLESQRYFKQGQLVFVIDIVRRSNNGQAAPPAFFSTPHDSIKHVVVGLDGSFCYGAGYGTSGS